MKYSSYKRTNKQTTHFSFPLFNLRSHIGEGYVLRNNLHWKHMYFLVCMSWRNETQHFATEKMLKYMTSVCCHRYSSVINWNLERKLHPIGCLFIYLLINYSKPQNVHCCLFIHLFKLHSSSVLTTLQIHDHYLICPLVHIHLAFKSVQVSHLHLYTLLKQINYQTFKVWRQYSC